MDGSTTVIFLQLMYMVSDLDFFLYDKPVFIYTMLQNMHETNTMTWYPSVKFIYQKLKLKETYCNYYLVYRLKQLIMKK